MKLYHGTNQLFDKFDQNKSRVLDDYYGGGVAYFTDTLKVAHRYAKSMVNKYKGEPYVIEANLNLGNVFDVDQQFTGKDLTKFVGQKKDVEDFARGAGLLKYGVDKYQVMASLESGNERLTGEQVFKGLSLGMKQTAKAREKLKKLGYDTLRYNGGGEGITTKHSVYIAFYNTNITIAEKYFFDSNGNKYRRVR